MYRITNSTFFSYGTQTEEAGSAMITELTTTLEMRRVTTRLELHIAQGGPVRPVDVLQEIMFTPSSSRLKNHGLSDKSRLQVT